MSRPRYVLQVGQAWWARVGEPQFGHTLTGVTEMPCWARRLSRRALDVFRLGTAMSGRTVYRKPPVRSPSTQLELPRRLDRIQEGAIVGNDDEGAVVGAQR